MLAKTDDRNLVRDMVKIENEDYLIVPQSAILILIRDDLHSLAD